MMTDTEKPIRESFDRQAVMKTIGAVITKSGLAPATHFPGCCLTVLV
jgi:hypothetical protein